MTPVSATQLALDFEAGISETHDNLKAFLRERIHHRPGGFMQKQLAAEMDLSPSELTRKLSDNPNDPRNFTVDDLERYLAATGDCSPIHYLIERWIVRSPKAAQRKISDLESELARLKAQQVRAV